MNGRTWTEDCDPKKTEASTIQALQFLAGSHFAQKPLDSTMQKAKQTETRWPCDRCPPSSPGWLCAWRSLDSSVLPAQEQAPSSVDLLLEAAAASVAHSHRRGRAWVCIKAPAQFPQSAAEGRE